ncbi:MAG TPA: O-antigen ligase family protein [Solirubrobacteraceae bacterium]|nr:O-antigen ligase family protein [Solirubrobacteraceae bacterium]
MRLRRASVECLLAGAPVLAIFVWMIFREGGYFERSWMPAAVVILAVGAASAIAQRAEVALPSRAARVAVAAFAAYVAWSFASILWASNAGDALEGSQRALLYLACFALFALLPWTPRTALVAVLAFVAAVTAAGVVTVVRLAGDAPLEELFIDARLRAPIGYHNAAAALWTMAAAPALVLAARREVAWWLRPPLLASATLLLELAILGQSRGWLYTLPVVLLVALLLSPDRLKLVVFAAFAACEVAIAAPDLLAVNSAGTDLDPETAQRAIAPVLDNALETLAATTAGALVAGLALVYAERVLRDRVVLGARARRATGVGLALAALAGGAAVVVAADGEPLRRVDSAWSRVTATEGTGAEGGSHLASLGSTRYDFWRVALDVWRDHPVLGVGQDNFVDAYARLRRSAFEEPRWVHSLPLRLLVHTGLVGAALFVAFLAAVAAGAAGAWRRGRERSAPAAVGAALLPGVVWIGHGSVEWLWEFPALSCAALALAGAAVALGRPVADRGPGGERDGHAGPAPRRRAEPAQRAVVAAALAVLVVGVAIIVPSLVADSEVSRAALHWREDPARALERLERARTLNPLAARPWLVEGLIESDRGRIAQARRAFARAAAKQPDAWYPRFAQGLLAAAAGDTEDARRLLLAARQRNPRDPLIGEALRRVTKRPMTLKEATRRIEERLDLRRNLAS